MAATKLSRLSRLSRSVPKASVANQDVTNCLLLNHFATRVSPRAGELVARAEDQQSRRISFLGEEEKSTNQSNCGTIISTRWTPTSSFFPLRTVLHGDAITPWKTFPIGPHREGFRSNSSEPAALFLGQEKQVNNRSSDGAVGRLRRNFSIGSSVAEGVANLNLIFQARKFSVSSPNRAAMKVKALDHVVLTVKEIEETCKFYSKVLGMERVTFGRQKRVALSFGRQKINLHQLGKEFDPKADKPTSGSADLCFITDAPLDAMQKHVEGLGVEIIQGPVARIGAMGALRSFYFRDPDLNLIEVSNYV